MRRALIGKDCLGMYVDDRLDRVGYRTVEKQINMYVYDVQSDTSRVDVSVQMCVHEVCRVRVGWKSQREKVTKRKKERVDMHGGGSRSQYMKRQSLSRVECNIVEQ